ncbi:MAG: cobalamin-binding protein [Armatimonadetes bacterium CG07_land_8_20_14_0_80_40_9]|nr:MAG: cobalamin-binding protein [Armatimonadetes bacterium CG07_land_8_20_14_0_80_40_9]
MFRLRFKILILLTIFLGGVGFSGFAFSSPGGFPLRLKDDLGREVVIKGKPQRIISLAPSLTEILFALGLEKKIVGVTSFCNYPAEAKKKGKVGSYSNPSLEKIINLRPDLVLVTQGNPLSLIKRLEKLKITVFAVDPQDVGEVIKTIKKIAKITSAVRKGKNLTNKMEKKLKRIVSKTKGRSENDKPKVFLMLWDNPLISVGSKTLLHNLVVLAGGRNVAAGSADYPIYNVERLLKQDPDVLILIGMGEDWQSKLRQIKKNKILKELKAVKKNKIYLIDPDLVNRPGPRIIEGLEKLSKIIHPEMF